MVSVKELKDWLNTIDENECVGIDDGGLTLCVVDNEQIYFEVGGIPE